MKTPTQLQLNFDLTSSQPQPQISLTSTSSSNQPQLQSQLNLNSIWLWHKSNPILFLSYFLILTFQLCWGCNCGWHKWKSKKDSFFYFHTSAGLKTSTQLQLNLNWSSFQPQPQFSLPSTLKLKSTWHFPNLHVAGHPTPPQICAIELDLYSSIVCMIPPTIEPRETIYWNTSLLMLFTLFSFSSILELLP